LVKDRPRRLLIVPGFSTQTSEEEALIEPANNVCSFNDYEIALQRQKKDETYNGY
jgi:hypothetical protein